MTYRFQELMFGLFMLAVGGALMLHSFSPQYALMAQDIQTGPMFFPQIILTIWIICAVAMIIRAWGDDAKKKVPFQWLRVAGAVAIMSMFIFFFDKIGYFPSGFCCFFGLGLILGHKHPGRLLLVSIVYAGFTDVLFRWGLKQYLPTMFGL
ncbi:MAG: tripartite tricarboxylate transporter TctB family protein [Lentisphaerae bacterium]|nr:tripartite tricarboxylate transporter TctB family protein [Lentisphaerota bacterium]